MTIAHVIGLGKSGLAAARLLRHQGWQVTLHDRSCTATLQAQVAPLANEGIHLHLGQPYDPQAHPALPQQVVVSPGVPWDLPGLVQARALGLDVVGEMGLAWRHLQPIPWVGITGTNGKTTTTALIAAIFKAAHQQAPACGNIGYAACEVALSQVQGEVNLDWVIAELSSYQIEAAGNLSPQIGVWTTFTPDHLARHYTLDNYFQIKARLLHQSHWVILNGDDLELRQRAPKLWPEALWVSTQGRDSLPYVRSESVYLEDGWVCQDGERLFESIVLTMPGNHNLQNLLLATAASLRAGIDPQAIALGVSQFPGVSHRLEYVGTWQGVDFINDSKATNYDAAAVGLSSVKAPAILIAGGEAKEGDDTSWIQEIQRKAVAVLLIGAAAPTFADRLRPLVTAPVEIVETLDAALDRCQTLIPELQPQVVLFSPACASFDQFANFEERGDYFRKLCTTLGAIPRPIVPAS